MKNKIFSSYLLFCVAVSLLYMGCKKQICMAAQPGADTYFVIKKGGAILKEDSILTRIRLYHLNKWGERVYNPSEDLSDGTILDDTSFIYLAQSYYSYPENIDYQNTGILFLRYLAGLSANSNIDNYYLEFPDGDVDTIYLKAEQVSCEQAWKERCQCEFPVRILKYNGQLVSEDTAYHLTNGQPVYVFNK